MINPKSVAILERIGVDVSYLQTYQVMTYEDPDTQIPINDIMDQMLMCRRQIPCTMKHLIMQQRLTIWMMTNKILQLEKRLDMKLDIRFEKLLEFIRVQDRTDIPVCPIPKFTQHDHADGQTEDGANEKGGL